MVTGLHLLVYCIRRVKIDKHEYSTFPHYLMVGSVCTALNTALISYEHLETGLA